MRVLPWVLALAACSGVAPTLAPIDDQIVAVGGELRLTLSASTPDGGAVAYGYASTMPNVRDRAELSERPDGTGVFILRPLAADVGTFAFDFTATAGGMSTTLTVQIEVKPAVGEEARPRFVNPLGPGTMLDIARQSCATIDVMVEDSDSTEVVIDFAAPRVPGAELVERGRKTAKVRFCPDENQKAADDQFLLRLSADDGDNAPAVINYAVVLKRPVEAGCAGAAPAISHRPLDEETLVALELTAEVSDDLGLKSAPIVYYSTENPGSAPDLARLSQENKLRQAPMVLVSGGATRATYRAEVPNPVADQAVGAEATLYYVITAVDNDDPKRNCDHFAQSPVYTMTVTNPGGQGQLAVCEPCTHDIQCGGAADACLPLGPGNEGFCARACGASGECPSGYACSPDVVRSVNDVKSRQCVPVAGSCGAALASCSDDAREENDSRAEAQARPALATGTTGDLVSCPSYGNFSDEDWYELEVAAEARVELALVGSRASDIDLDLFAADGALLAQSRGPESEEGITRVLPAGSYLVRAKARTILGKTRVERNGYELTYTTGAACDDDAFEDDDDRAHARPQPIFWGLPQRGNQICGGDDDLFKVELAEGETLLVDLLFDQTTPTQNLDLHLLDATGRDLTPCSEAQPQSCSVFQGQGTASDEHYEYLVDASEGCSPLCTYYVVVHGWNGSENAYELILDVIE